jgi:hypothetical protein
MRDRDADGGDEVTEPYDVGGAGALVPSGAIRAALPMPLGSDSTLGLAGPVGMPETAELPAPAEPAGGTSCANASAANGPADISESAMAPTSAELRNIRGISMGSRCKDDVGRAFP